MADATTARGKSVGRVTFLVAAITIVASIAIVIAFDTTTFGLWFDDIGEGVVSAVAGICAFHRSRNVEPARRRSWLFLAVGCAAWAAGEAIWCWNELVRHITPFPSIADIGYLAFSLVACVALLSYPTDGNTRSRTNRALDAVSATAAVALIAWITVLDAVVGNHGNDHFAYTISLMYPLSDIAVLVLSVLTLSRIRRDRIPLILVALGFIALSVSDSAFVALQASAEYAGGVPDLGWFVGFILIAAGALARERDAVSGQRIPAASDKAPLTFVPYIPLLVALVATMIMTVVGETPHRGQLALAAGLVILLLARQYLTLRANVALTTNLADREAELHHQAFHDNLTGLANRALFQDRLAHALELHARDLHPVAVIFLDLDDFKLVNDTLGHTAGDELLVNVAERITHSTRSGDTVARLGGDEFAVLLESSGDPSHTAARITEAMGAPFLVADQHIVVAASLGIVSLDPATSTSADVLVTQADTAMYAAKRGGKGRIVVYRDGMSLLELSDKQMSAALAQAIRNETLRVAFQPILELENGAVHSIETLARWNHEGHDIPPDVFIPVAERTGVIGELTEYVIRRACEHAVACAQIPGYEDLGIAVNIPPQQIGTPKLEATISTMIERYQIRPVQLCIEITETGLFANIAAAKETIGSLRKLGVRVALDDFGVGYSSLAQLHNIELDSVKIDRSFVERLESDVRQVKFLRTIIRLGQDVDLTVIAEGVERPDQLQVLKRLGCPLAQGYLFAKPMTGDEMLAYLVDAPQRLSAPQTVLTHF